MKKLLVFVVIAVFFPILWSHYCAVKKLIPDGFLGSHLVGHNGAGINFPEDTIESIEIAHEEFKCGILEVDLQVTKEGDIAIIHDFDVARTTDGEGFYNCG